MPKIVLVFFFVKLYFFLFYFDIRFFSIVLVICGIFSLFIGIFYAMYQYKIKRFLAYSSIANVGYVLVALSTMTFDGFFSGLFFIFCYLFSLILLFFFLLNFRTYKLKEFYNLLELSLLNNSNNVILFIISLIFLSFAGIPPLMSFFGKFFIFFSLFNSLNYFILIIVFFFSFISSFYYIRVIRFLFFTKIKENMFFFNFKFNYVFFFILFFNLLFFFFFDFFGECIYFFLISSFF